MSRLAPPRPREAEELSRALMGCVIRHYAGRDVNPVEVLIATGTVMAIAMRPVEPAARQALLEETGAAILEEPYCAEAGR